MVFKWKCAKIGHAKITQTAAFNYIMSYHFLCNRGIRPARTEQVLVLLAIFLLETPYPLVYCLQIFVRWPLWSSFLLVHFSFFQVHIGCSYCSSFVHVRLFCFGPVVTSVGQLVLFMLVTTLFIAPTIFQRFQGPVPSKLSVKSYSGTNMPSNIQLVPWRFRNKSRNLYWCTVPVYGFCCRYLLTVTCVASAHMHMLNCYALIRGIYKNTREWNRNSPTHNVMLNGLDLGLGRPTDRRQKRGGARIGA